MQSQIGRNHKSNSRNVFLRIAFLLVLAGVSAAILSNRALTRGNEVVNAAAAGQNAPAGIGVDAERRVREAYGQLAVSFEENRGQVDAQVKFISHSVGATMFLTNDSAWFVSSAPAAGGDERDESTGESARPRNALRRDSGAARLDKRRMYAVQMKIEGANPQTQIVGENEMEGRVNYFRGSDPEKWQQDVPTYGIVRYREIYQGVDLVYYGTAQNEMEYDFRIEPGANAGQISVQFAGAESLEVDASGDLVIKTPAGDMRQRKPLVYQETEDGRRHEVASGYALKGDNRVGFTLGDYDRRRALVIDPVVLSYSTFLGGSAPNFEIGYGIAVDSAGNAHVTGRTTSTDFPTTTGAFDVSFNGSFDGFVTKLNANGTARVYSTYLGGGTFDECNDIAIDSTGNAYITGITTSTNFPTTVGAFDRTYNGPSGVGDAFITKLNSTGSALVYSTYLGGSTGRDEGEAIAVDSSGNAYITGQTVSSNFPTTTGAFDSTFADVDGDIFVTKLNAAGSALVFSTFLGGGGADSFFEIGFGIAVDSASSAYVTGYTDSANFPTTTGAFDTTFNGGFGDLFVTKLNTAGSALVYSTFVGGSGGFDGGTAIAIDSAGNAYVTGETNSSDFPTTSGAFDTTLNGKNDGFVTKLNPTGSGLVYSTFLGGSGFDLGNGIAVNSGGEAYVTGVGATNFPVTNGAFDTTYQGSGDGFATKLNAAGSAFVYSTFLGGSSSDAGNGIAVDSAGSAYVTGTTTSADFPTTAGAFDTTITGNNDAFIAKLSETAPPPPPPLPSPTTFTVNTTNDMNDGACNAAHCSLREAIIAANANAGRDTIAFAIPGTGVRTITPASFLPTITDSATIDGYTQTGSSRNTLAVGSDAVLLIELNGSVIGTSTFLGALRFTGANSAVSGVIINRFQGDGIELESAGNVIEGNFIGTDPAGTTAFGNNNGIGVRAAGTNNLIGGLLPGARNVVSGNRSQGVSIGDSQNIIQGNYIGTNASGSAALGNTFTGLDLDDDTNTAGGTSTAARNVISGNGGEGIEIDGSLNIVQGNFIGTNASGTGPLGNSRNGIDLDTGNNNTIGGTTAGAVNVIANNTLDGVLVQSRETNNRILSNSIFNNVRLGINLEGGTPNANGVNPNDLGDPDTGGNNLQNYPVLSSAASAGGPATIQGTYNSMPNTAFRLEFFSNPACDPSGFGEAETFIGSQETGTDANGNAAVSFTSSIAVITGRFITATATDPGGNTSELSACVIVMAVTPSPTPTPTPTPGGSISGVVTYGTTPAGQTTKFVPGVLLSAMGSPASSVLTDNEGSYSLTGLGTGAYTVTPTKSGDVNGISALDASRVAQHAAGLIVLTSNQILAGDATNNGTLSALDASRIAQFAAGIPNPGIAGTWKFLPASRHYPSVTGALSGENYEAILVGDVTGNWTPSPAPGTSLDRESAIGDIADPEPLDWGSGKAGAVDLHLAENLAAMPGTVLTLPVLIGDTTGKGLVAYEFTLEFDHRTLSPTLDPVTTIGTLSQGWAITVNSETPGRITVTAYSIEELTGEGTLLNLNFTVTGTSDTSTRLKWTRFEINESEIQSRPEKTLTAQKGIVRLFVPRSNL